MELGCIDVWVGDGLGLESRALTFPVMPTQWPSSCRGHGLGMGCSSLTCAVISTLCCLSLKANVLMMPSKAFESSLWKLTKCCD